MFMHINIKFHVKIEFPSKFSMHNIQNRIISINNVNEEKFQMSSWISKFYASCLILNTIQSHTRLCRWRKAVSLREISLTSQLRTTVTVIWTMCSVEDLNSRLLIRAIRGVISNHALNISISKCFETRSSMIFHMTTVASTDLFQLNDWLMQPLDIDSRWPLSLLRSIKVRLNLTEFLWKITQISIQCKQVHITKFEDLLSR